MELLLRPHSDIDLLAQNLSRMGALAAAMPPSWQHHAVSHLTSGPQGEHFGVMLPGKGLYVHHNLYRLGVRRPIPFVHDLGWLQSLGMRLKRLWHNERGLITGYDQVISARNTAQDRLWGKASFNTIANTWSTIFSQSGLPQAGTYTAIPGGAAPDRTNAGALTLLLANPGGGLDRYLLTLGFTSAQIMNMLMLVDLLVAAGNISLTTGAAQTINTTALTRYTSGAGVMMTYEVTTTPGPAATLSASYTNQAGTAGQITPSFQTVASATTGRLMPVTIGPFTPLQSGDSGVRSVETITVSVTSAAGVLALNLFMPLMFVAGVSANVYSEVDSTVQIDGLTQLVKTAGGVLGCLTAYLQAGAASTGVITSFMRSVEG